MVFSLTPSFLKPMAELMKLTTARFLVKWMLIDHFEKLKTNKEWGSSEKKFYIVSGKEDLSHNKIETKKRHVKKRNMNYNDIWNDIQKKKS